MPNRYKNISRTRDVEGRRYIRNPIYPDIPVTEDDTYLITTGGDRYDTLAVRFYGDTSLWWIIAAANSDKKRDGLVVKPGIQLRIPASKDSILTAYDNLNSSR